MLPYAPTDDGIVCRRPERFFNRPLYCTNRPSVVLAGELPGWLLAKETLCLGRLLPRIRSKGREWDARRPYRLITTFKANRVEYDWRTTGSLKLHMEVYPSVSGTGCWIGMRSGSEEPVSVRLRWLGLGVSALSKAGLNSSDPAWNRELVKGIPAGLEPRDYRLEVQKDAAEAIIERPSYYVALNGTGKGAECHPKLVEDPVTAILKWTQGMFVPSRRKGTLGELRLTLSSDTPDAWLWWGEKEFAPRDWGEAEAAREFHVRRGRAMVCSTPSRALDAAAPHTAVAAEGCYYPPFFVHGAMSWDEPYLGWSVFYKGAALGWSERLRKEFDLAFAAQETKDASKPYQRSKELTLAGPDSHFYGRGHVDFHQYRYNMQEVFFDQVIEAHAHRLLGNMWPRAKKALREHVAWEKRCFDPTNRGLFENCINTWASDSVWYGGGAGTISTAYNYRANLALGRLQEARRIRRTANALLWLKRKGWYAEYQDPGPEPRLHESACLYSVYLPITCGLADDFQSRQLLQYARHELENVTFRNHPGRLCWLSQWEPYHWSVEELGHGETLMLALASFVAGDADLGWDYLQGVIHESQYDDIAPGGLQMIGKAGYRNIQGATDFADPVSIYTWTLSRGLAGFRPVPNGPLRWEPSFPKEWRKAELQFPRHGVSFLRETGRDQWVFRQTAGQKLELDLPLPGSRRIRAFVDGRQVAFALRAGMGAPRIRLRLKSRDRHEVVIRAEGGRPWSVQSKSRPYRPGDSWSYRAPGASRILETGDPQEVLKDLSLNARTIRGRIVGIAGHRLLFVKLVEGECNWWRPMEIRVESASASPCFVPRRSRGKVEGISLESSFNGRIKDLCAERCRGPRAQSCGAQIGSDGYSPWTYPLWKRGPPQLDASLWHRNRSNLIVDGIPFLRPRGSRDAVLVSRWDHLPREVVIPLNLRLKRLYLLVALNTSVMQAHMDVLNVTLAGEGTERIFPLNHPRDILSGIHEYDLRRNRSALPRRLPRRINLGRGLHGCVLQLTLPRPEMIDELRWTCLGLETIGGLLGVSYACPRRNHGDGI